VPSSLRLGFAIAFGLRCREEPSAAALGAPGFTVAWERMPLRGHVRWLAPLRARAASGVFDSAPASTKTAGHPGRPPAGLIRPPRSVPQVAPRAAADGSADRLGKLLV